ncbi:MAG: hypothetical protein DRN66_03470 [Candidatus Nanohalarchaeota archaeon]|nr:MAG: hypothetical protein DRN66_03470 [Candidatus Nanohaloarchaeota archaeon]
MILLLTGLSSILAALLCFRKQFSFNLVLIGYIVLSPAFPILLFPLVLIICYQIYLSLLKRKFKKLKKLAETSPEDLAGLKTTTVTIHIKRGDED